MPLVDLHLFASSSRLPEVNPVTYVCLHIYFYDSRRDERVSAIAKELGIEPAALVRLNTCSVYLFVL